MELLKLAIDDGAAADPTLRAAILTEGLRLWKSRRENRTKLHTFRCQYEGRLNIGNFDSVRSKLHDSLHDFLSKHLSPSKSTNLYTSLQRAVCSLCQTCTLPVIHHPLPNPYFLFLISFFARKFRHVNSFEYFCVIYGRPFRNALVCPSM